MAFLNMLLGQAGGTGGQDLPANIAAILKNDPNNSTGLTALLQKAYPNASADQLQQAVTQLEAGTASAAAIKPTLTSDLSASLTPSMQQEDPNILAQLQHKFDALTKNGPLTADKIDQFRKDAIDFLKDKGLDNSSINQYLVTLSTDLGDKLPVAMAAQLAMPLPAQTVASLSSASDDTDTDTAPIQSAGNAHSKAAVSAAPSDDNADESDDAATGLQAEDDEPVTHDTTSLLLKPAAPRAQATNDQPQGLQSEQKPQQGLNNAADRVAPAAPAQANAAPAAKPVATAAAHFFVMNNAQGGSDGFGTADDGQPGFQQAGGQLNMTGVTPSGAAPASSSFANYMSSASADNAQAPQTVQNVALQIQQNASNGVTTFTMQLEPAELGRLEVRLKFDRDGGIKAHLIADKPETLSMLRQDASQIHRILQQSGLNADDSSLSFDLRQQGQQQNTDQSYNGAGRASAYDAGASASSDAIQANIAIQTMGTIRPGGVNIMV